MQCFVLSYNASLGTKNEFMMRVLMYRGLTVLSVLFP